MLVGILVIVIMTMAANIILPIYNRRIAAKTQDVQHRLASIEMQSNLL